MRLSLANLALLKGVAVPSYDRAALSPGILHCGPGNFHRGHEAVYLDDLFNQGIDHNWAIVGAGVSNGAKRIRRALEDQDWLTTVVERDADMASGRVIGSMVDFVPDADDYGPLKERMLDPNIKIVSMTVTEGGYFVDPATGEFDPEDPKIKADAANPDSPMTVFGMIVQALKKRREAGIDPFAVMSCDNVPHNGDVVRDVTAGLAALYDKELAEWIRDNVGFPNSMVDRIVPATTDLERKYVSQRFKYEDDWPVFCEPFRQWIMEDSFPHGRPALEKAGVKFVPDVTPYELKKIRILNGGHATLSYPAALLGLEYVHDAVEHPVIGPFLDTVERTEIIPGVPPVPDVSLPDYWKTIFERFENPTVLDRIDRNCKDGSDRQPKFIIPPAADCLKDGRPVDGLAMVSAMWCKYCAGKTENDNFIEVDDPIFDVLEKNAKKAVDDPSAWLGMTHIYGDVGKNPVFVEAFSKALHSIYTDGVEAAMKNYVKKNAQVAAK